MSGTEVSNWKKLSVLVSIIIAVVIFAGVIVGLLLGTQEAVKFSEGDRLNALAAPFSLIFWFVMFICYCWLVRIILTHEWSFDPAPKRFWWILFVFALMCGVIISFGLIPENPS